MVYMPQSAVKLAVMMAHTGPDSKMDFHGTCPFWRKLIAHVRFLSRYVGVTKCLSDAHHNPE